MMQQIRVAATSALRLRIFMAATGRRSLASATSAGRTADPQVHGGEIDKEDSVYPVEPHTMNDAAEPKPAAEDSEQLYRPRREPDTDPLKSTPKSTPYASSPRLQSVGVNQPLDPSLQQKKRNSTAAAATSLDGVSCAGLDGSPWPEDKEAAAEKEQGGGRVAEDNVEYFKHRKASPLAELEIADTRKPVTRATDGAGGGSDVIGWLPEQLDTAEESLLRATRIWRESAMRGDPDAPQSRVLRALRGEI